MPELSSLEQAFRPTIQIKYLVERIFQGTPFSYTSNFIDTDADLPSCIWILIGENNLQLLMGLGLIPHHYT